jgi:hypothetical protein
MPPCCVKHLKEVLYYLHDLFEEKKITYWLDFGTLLGAVRNGRIIPFDTDGDLGLYLEDRPKIMQLNSRINNDGFCYACYTPKRANDTHIKICRSKDNHMMVDLFFWKKDRWNAMHDPQGLNEPKSFPDYFIQKLEPIYLYGRPLWGPRDTEKFLEFRYGKTWQVPQNRKVHFEEARECHKPAFSYAKKKGWNKQITLI